MTPEIMKARLSVITGETDDDILLTYLDLAGEVITAKCYPYHPGKPVPERYQNRQIEIAAYLLNKRGAEGETSHNENGINRSYESASVPASMLAGIMPFASSFVGAEESQVGS